MNNMDSETLFVEEAEPPGRLTGSVGPKQYNDDFDTPLTTLQTPAPVPVTPAPGFAVPRNSRAMAFRKRFFPRTALKEWNDWRWQLRNRICDLETLGRMIRLSEDERHALSGSAAALPLAITPYYMSLLDPWDPRHALRRTVVPTVHEHFRGGGEADDPLHEDEDSPVPGSVHRYPDRPLTLSDDRLEWLLARLRRIPHVELIRIGTKAPVVLPQRITPALVRMFKRYHPLWISIHAAHPDELTPEAARACVRLADAGIPLGSQTVR